jgi:hypothetical protein
MGGVQGADPHQGCGPNGGSGAAHPIPTHRRHKEAGQDRRSALSAWRDFEQETDG